MPVWIPMQMEIYFKENWQLSFLWHERSLNNVFIISRDGSASVSIAFFVYLFL